MEMTHYPSDRSYLEIETVSACINGARLLLPAGAIVGAFAALAAIYKSDGTAFREAVSEARGHSSFDSGLLCDRVVIPVHLRQLTGSDHYVILLLQFNRDQPHFFYLDPFGGNHIPPPISRMVNLAFPSATMTNLGSSNFVIQRDTYNCGPLCIQVSLDFLRLDFLRLFRAGGVNAIQRAMTLQERGVTSQERYTQTCLAIRAHCRKHHREVRVGSSRQAPARPAAPTAAPRTSLALTSPRVLQPSPKPWLIFRPFLAFWALLVWLWEGFLGLIGMSSVATVASAKQAAVARPPAPPPPIDTRSMVAVPAASSSPPAASTASSSSEGASPNERDPNSGIPSPTSGSSGSGGEGAVSAAAMVAPAPPAAVAPVSGHPPSPPPEESLVAVM